MTEILFDTDYIIDYLRGKDSKFGIIHNSLKFNSLYISILTVYELYAGMRDSEQQATDDFIRACRIEPVTMEIAQYAGIFRMKQRQKGITLSIVDCIIAETARAKGYRIATMNKKHYPQSVLWEEG